jgi:hypothetical protein
MFSTTAIARTVIAIPSARSGHFDGGVNTALMTGYGAEMAFAHAVLLVEGDGDRLYFESLRRRLAKKSKTGAIDQLYVVPTGGKTAFAPWLRMLVSTASKAVLARWLSTTMSASEARKLIADPE